MAGRSGNSLVQKEHQQVPIGRLKQPYYILVQSRFRLQKKEEILASRAHVCAMHAYGVRLM